MASIAPSNLPSSVDDIKYNCIVPLNDIFAGRKRKNNQEEDEEKENSDPETDDDYPDYEAKTIRSNKTETLKNTMNKMSEQKPMVLNSYEKMIEEKRAERIAFLKSMEIYKIKEEISEAIGGMKQLKRNANKVHSSQSFGPPRRSKRLANIEVDCPVLNKADSLRNDYEPVPSKITFKGALKSESPYEECVKDLRIEEPKCNQRFISYDKTVFEKMTLNEFNVRKAVSHRVTSAAWYPSKEDLVLAAGDYFGDLILWKIQDSETTPHVFKTHADAISNMQFSLFDPVQLITASYDGGIRCGDLIKHTFNEIYMSDSCVTSFDFLSPKTFLVSHANGEVAVFDRNANRITNEKRHVCHDAVIKTVSVHPVNKNIFITCDNRKSIRLWDLRNLQKNPVLEIFHLEHHKRTVHSAYFSPVTGNSILTTSLDHSICIFDSTNLTQDIKLRKKIKHSVFPGMSGAAWLPNSDDLFAVGCREQRIQIYDKNCNLYHNLSSDNLHVSYVQCFHPYRSALACGNSGGRLFVFT